VAISQAPKVIDDESVRRCARHFFNKLLRLWLAQLCTVLLVAGPIFYWFDAAASYSVIFGGLVFLVPNVYFAVYALCYNRELVSGVVVRNFYKAEAGKFFLSSVGFAIVFVLAASINVPVLFASYIALMLVQWVAAVQLGF
jgi:ATP synthase protein I